MGPVDFAIIGVIVLIVGLAIWYVYKAKKSGKKCIGCPDGGSCTGHCGDGCNCGGESACNCGCSEKK